MQATAGDLVAFWLEGGPARWFARDDAFDAALRERFLEAHLAASRGELAGWMEDADGALALVLLLDQIPRNLFRGSAHAFATDPLARLQAARAIDAGFDRRVDPALRIFFYMPFEHSEDIADQQRAVALCREMDDAGYMKYAFKHRDVIARFGRFPHRNRVLGRTSTAEEAAYLEAGGGFG
jgi:uncharacterized protein (DUF924 family)